VNAAVRAEMGCVEQGKPLLVLVGDITREPRNQCIATQWFRMREVEPYINLMARDISPQRITQH
jgi:hypothetical protein